MLTLRYQAVECFLAGVAPAPSEEGTETENIRWDNQAIERFEELTQVLKMLGGSQILSMFYYSAI